MYFGASNREFRGTVCTAELIVFEWLLIISGEKHAKFPAIVSTTNRYRSRSSYDKNMQAPGYLRLIKITVSLFHSCAKMPDSDSPRQVRVREHVVRGRTAVNYPRRIIHVQVIIFRGNKFVPPWSTVCLRRELRCVEQVYCWLYDHDSRASVRTETSIKFLR